jgi:AcrR family transcriptional regulator
VSTTPSLLGRPPGASGDETRRRIIDATVRCVAEVGYSQATIREIARTARVTSGTLYHYFSNKTELINATFIEMADIVLPRLSGAATSADGVLERLTAILDECESINRDYPFVAAFDRAIRAESAQHLHLGESSETMFAALRNVIVDVMKEGKRQGALGPNVNVQSASSAIFTLIRGLNEYTTTAPNRQYHSTVEALKALVTGALFDYDKLASPRRRAN